MSFVTVVVSIATNATHTTRTVRTLMLYMVVLITMSNTYTTMIRISPAGAAFTCIIISECKGTTVRCMRINMHWRVSKHVMLLHF